MKWLFNVFLMVNQWTKHKIAATCESLHRPFPIFVAILLFTKEIESLQKIQIISIISFLQSRADHSQDLQFSISHNRFVILWFQLWNA